MVDLTARTLRVSQAGCAIAGAYAAGFIFGWGSSVDALRESGFMAPTPPTPAIFGVVFLVALVGVLSVEFYQAKEADA